MTTYRHHLPQLGETLFLTDGGLETDLIFHHGLELPLFAAIDLLRSQRGTRTLRIRGIRANASRLSHAELAEAKELDDGNPEEFGALYADLRSRFPHITVPGGCCGTDQRHVCAAGCAAGEPPDPLDFNPGRARRLSRLPSPD